MQGSNVWGCVATLILILVIGTMWDHQNEKAYQRERIEANKIRADERTALLNQLSGQSFTTEQFGLLSKEEQVELVSATHE